MKLWCNGSFHLFGDNYRIYHQVLTDKGKIIAFDEDVYKFHIDEKIDLNKAFVFPGFVDAHIHLLGYGILLSYPDLSFYHQKHELIGFLSKQSKLEKLLFKGLDSNIGINQSDLDLLFPDNVVILRHKDYHGYTLNTFAAKHLGIITHRGFITDSKVVQDYFINKTEKEYEEALILAIEKVYQFGITSVHIEELNYYHGYVSVRLLFERVLKDYPLRTHMLIHESVMDEHIKYQPNFHPYINYGAFKTFADGTLGSKSAYVSRTYLGTHDQGINYLENVEKAIIKTRTLKGHVAIHTIGDLALEGVITLLEKYPNSHGYDRIIHASLASKKSLKRFSKLNVILDVQPQFIRSDFNIIKHHIDHRIIAYPLSLYQKEGVLLTGGSDAPVEVPNPLLGIYEASRKSFKYRLSRYEAVKLYTINPNILTNKKDQDSLGLADFTILSKNILEVKENELLEDLVLMTVIDEKIVYSK